MHTPWLCLRTWSCSMADQHLLTQIYHLIRPSAQDALAVVRNLDTRAELEAFAITERDTFARPTVLKAVADRLQRIPK